MQRAAWAEQAELQELNARLGLYVGRVRDLEQENRRLAQEVAALSRPERRAGRPEEREREVRELRRAVAELSRAKGQAELERDALRGEKARLEGAAAQSRELRLRRLEPALAEQQRRLAQLGSDCAALEALLAALLAEEARLREARRRRPAALPPPPRRGPAPLPRPELEARGALVLSWSGQQSLERFEGELRALQALEGRLGREELRETRGELEKSRRWLEELQRRCRELGALAERLERERLEQQRRHGGELAEYQVIIETLEEEKRFLTMAIAECLKDYHQLLQLKAGLSLEIATYKALLEGEYNQWIQMWIEGHGKKLPQGVQNILYGHSNRLSAYQQEKGKRTFPAIQNVDARYKSPQTNISSSAAYFSRTKRGGPQAGIPEKMLQKEAFRLEHRPLTTPRKDAAYETYRMGQKEASYHISREREVQQRKPPERIPAEKRKMTSSVKESTTFQKPMTRPIISGSRTTVDTSSSQSYSLNSDFKGTKYDTMVSSPTEEEKCGVVKGEDRKETLAKEITGSAFKTVEKLPGVERHSHFTRKDEVTEGWSDKKIRVEEVPFKDKLVEDKMPPARWEEHIKVHSVEQNISVDLARSKKAVEIPVHSEYTQDEIQKNKNNIDKTLQDLRTSVGEGKDEAGFNVNRATNQENSKIDSLLTESIAENIVSDILKGVIQTSFDIGPSPDPKITSFEKVTADGKVKTEISIQSKLQEDDISVSEKFDLESFLNKDVKVLDGSKAEGIIEDIINAGMKGGEDKGKRIIKVEITEEPETVVDERMEFSTSFEVEEAEDSLPSVTEHPCCSAEEKSTTNVAGYLKQNQPGLAVSHVEEVTEGDDIVDEGMYFVSTPDEYPLGYEQEQDESSVYGQIHIEEESSVKYSWQDEFLQGSQTKINESSPELIYQVTGGGASSFLAKEEPPKEKVSHAESIVIEKEIKIPHDFQESIKGLFSQESKEPKYQLKEALEKLEETLPESVKQELCALTKDNEADSSNLEIDIKKVGHSKEEGLFTIVAEVNLSQTLDSDQFTTELLGEGVTDEMMLPEHSSSEDTFDKYIHPESETCSNQRSHVGIDVSSTPWTTEDPSKGSFNINRHIRRVVVGPTEIHKTEQVFYEDSVSEQLRDSSETPDQSIYEEFLPKSIISDRLGKEEKLDVNTTIKHIKLSPMEFVKEEIIFTGPLSEEPQKFSGVRQIFSSEGSVDHITLGQKEVQSPNNVVFQDSVSSREETLEKGDPVTEISRSRHHIHLRPDETKVEQRVWHSPPTESVHSVEFSSTDRPSGSSRSLGQIKIGRQETSFVFQMDVTNTEGREPEATILVSNRQEADISKPENAVKVWSEGEPGSDKPTFEQTVQLQRMVDQRSVVSDEKKIALLYLNENEDDDEGGPWF